MQRLKKAVRKIKTMAPREAQSFLSAAVQKMREVVSGTKSVSIDYPVADEVIPCGYYTFRLGTISNVGWVQISINGGEWQHCRQTSGYWWFDWYVVQPGDFYVEAKVLLENGAEEKTDKRRFKVVQG